MKNFTRTILILALFAPMGLFAQNTGVIKGKVFDQVTNEPLPYANVYVDAAGQLIGTTSDEEGRFTLKPLNPGVYNVKFSFTGYQTQTIAGVRVNPDKITVLDNTTLAIAATSIGPGAEITAWKQKLIDPEEPGKMTIAATQLEHNPAIRTPLKMVSNIIPGVTESKDGQGLHFRGSRTSAIAYFIDGVRQSDNFSPVPGSAIGSMTVYTGGLPAKYGDVTGGVIVIETKSYFDLYNEWVAKEEMLTIKKKAKL